MKKILFTLSLLLILPQAFATKARLEALGQDGNRGSFYIEDFRSIFYNPAYLNLKKNAIITEWGQSADSADSSTAPHAEGGILGDYGSFTFGAYLGSELDSHNEFKNSKFIGQDNRMDFFFAGDAGMLWGLRAYYADSVDETSGVKKANSAYGMGLGVIMGSFETYADVGLKDLSTGADGDDDKWDGNLSLRVGGVYHLSSFTLQFELQNFSFTQRIGSASDEGDMRSYRFAVAREYAVNKTAKIFSDLSFVYLDHDYTGVSFEDEKGYKLPLNIAFETDLNEWLQVRGSLTHTLFSRQEIGGKKTSDRNSTEVAAGLRYHASKFNVDGIVGQDSAGNKAGHLGTVSRVAVEYLF